MRTSPTVFALIGVLSIGTALGSGALTSQPERDRRISQPDRDRQPTLSERDEQVGNKRLHKRMEEIASNLKKVAGAVRESDAKTALKHVAKMQEHLLKAKLMTPAIVMELDRADRPEKVTEFRRRTALALIEMTHLEIQILDGDFEAALDTVAGSLLKAREDGHAIFNPDD